MPAETEKTNDPAATPATTPSLIQQAADLVGQACSKLRSSIAQSATAAAGDPSGSVEKMRQTTELLGGLEKTQERLKAADAGANPAALQGRMIGTRMQGGRPPQLPPPTPITEKK